MNTQNLNGLGYREIGMLAELLKEYADNGSTFLNVGDTYFSYNPNSDTVYLSDDDGNMGFLNEDGKLEQWETCDNCNAEGFVSTFKVNEDGVCDACDIKHNA